MLGELIDKKSYGNGELNAMTWEEKSRLIQNDPVTCARHFDFQVQQFILKFLLRDCALLGKIEDWYYRVEFQQRGSPHIHMLTWIEGAPKFGENSDEDVCRFVDNTISCSKPTDDCVLDDLVSRQVHNHSFTCKQKFKKQCRFHFSQPPMKTTQIFYPLMDSDQISDINQYKAIWKRINEQLNAMKEGEGRRKYFVAHWATWYDNREPSSVRLQKCVKTDSDGSPIEIFDDDNRDDDMNVSVIPSNDLTMKKHQKHINKRSKPRIIRSVWYSKDNHPEKHYRELLMLFTAWRNEDTDLLEDCETYMKWCQMLREQINKHLSQYAKSSAQRDQVLDDIQTVEYNDGMWASVAPNTHHRECSYNEEHLDEPLVTSEANNNYDLSEDLGIPSSSVNYEHNISIDEIQDEDYRQTVRSLNTKQFKFFLPCFAPG